MSPLIADLIKRLFGSPLITNIETPLNTLLAILNPNAGSFDFMGQEQKLLLGPIILGSILYRITNNV